MAQIYNTTETLARLNGKTYRLVMTQEPNEKFHNKCSEYRKIDRNIYWYYFQCTEKEFQEHKNAMIEKLHSDVHHKYYDILDTKEQNIDIDNLNDDLFIDEYLNE